MRASLETRNMINQASAAVTGSTSMSSWLRRQAPVLTLVLLPALLIEVLYGSTPLERLYLVVPEVLVYGCGALLIRTVVRMRGLDWISIIVLGIAFAVAEECVILQTSLSPFFFGGYGRVLGVNTVYLLAMLGYESVWAILLSILLTEIIFPARREEPWIGGRGLVVAAVLFVAGSLMAWYSWTRFGIEHFSHGQSYNAPALTVISAVLAIAVLVALGMLPRAPRPAARRRRRALRPWLMGLAAFWLALPWFGLTIVAYAAPPMSPLITIAAGISWAAGATLVVGHWTTGSDFGDRHRLALIIGALTASWLEGFIIVSSAGAVDAIGKLLLDLLAIALFVLLAREVKTRARPSDLVSSSAGKPV